MQHEEITAFVIGDSKETQSVPSMQDDEVDCRIQLCDQETLANDFDLVTSQQALDLSEFEFAIKSPTLMAVNNYIALLFTNSKRISEKGVDKVNEFEKLTTDFVASINNIALKKE